MFANGISFLSRKPSFAELIRKIGEDSDFLGEVLQHDHLKRVLINDRPLELPHWILGFADSNMEGVKKLLKDDAFRQSLPKEVFACLTRLYPEITVFVRHEKLDCSDLPESRYPEEVDSSHITLPSA